MHNPSDPRNVPLLSPATFSSQYYSRATDAAASSYAPPPHVHSLTVAPAESDADGVEEAEGEGEDADANLTFPSMFVMPGRWQWLFFFLVALFSALAFTVLKAPLERHGVTSDDLLRYGSIPLISIVFTYMHIWLALWMTFYPIKYFGCLQIPGTNVGFGWQGIIPFKAEKMARMATQLMTQRLFDVRAIFARLDPERVASEMGPALYSTLDEVIGSVAQLHSPDLWELLPHRVKAELITQAHEDAPPAVAKLMLQMQENIHDVFDIEAMVVDALVKDKALLNNIFIKCGHAELSFIRNSGAYMGGIFGAIQMVIWLFYSNKWLLPAFGFVVGVLTNWLALKMIFEPVQPLYPCGRRCGPRIQGLFLQRQSEVSAVYARTISKQVLNSRNILASLIAGPMTDRLFALVYEHVKTVVDEYAGVSKPLLQISVGAALYARIKEDVCERFIERLPVLLMSLESYTDRALDMERTIREKMSALPPEEFEGLLHPVFQEDEWKLVLMGGVLGVVIGFAQIHILGA